MAKFILTRASNGLIEAKPHEAALYDSINEVYYIELNTLQELLDFTQNLNYEYYEWGIILNVGSQCGYDGSITIYDDFIE